MMKKGFTLIEVLVGVALTVIVFLGIFGAYTLGIKVVGKSKIKTVAIEIANREIEKIRNMPYGSVGIIDGELPVPEGSLEEIINIESNGVDFEVKRQMKYVADTADGTGGADECDLDYKVVDLIISWTGKFAGELILSSNITPKNNIEELSSCTAQPGGILTVQVSDAYGLWEGRGPPLIEIIDPDNQEVIDFFSPEDGTHGFPLVEDVYKVRVTKTGYSSGQTYGIDEVAIPEKPHVSVLEGGYSEISFPIDKVSTFEVDTFLSAGLGYFSDTFVDDQKVSELVDTVINGGAVVLRQENGFYLTSGYVVSEPIAPGEFLGWDEFFWDMLELDDTSITTQVWYLNGEDWAMVPNSALPGNAAGFDYPPVDLSTLDPEIYTSLELRAYLSTDDVEVTPSLYSWQADWDTSEPIPVSNIDFNLQGEKIIGLDEDEEPVYKYREDHTSGIGGHLDISDLEWDVYSFQITDANLILDEIIPVQPIGIDPDVIQPVSIYLRSENSLFVHVKDDVTGDPVFAASVRVYNAGLTYDQTRQTDQDGESSFVPIDADTYTVEITAPGFDNYSSQFSVSGNSLKIIEIERIE